jgi:hypothetical protein
MLLGRSALAAIVVLAGVGFGGGYAVARAGGDDPVKTPRPAAPGASLPDIPKAGKAPRIRILGEAAALPASRARKPTRPKPDSGPPPDPTPDSSPEPPTSTPRPGPTTQPPRPTPAPPDPDDIIEG